MMTQTMVIRCISIVIRVFCLFIQILTTMPTQVDINNIDRLLVSNNCLWLIYIQQVINEMKKGTPGTPILSPPCPQLHGNQVTNLCKAIKGNQSHDFHGGPICKPKIVTCHKEYKKYEDDKNETIKIY